MLYLPLITIVMENVSRLDTSESNLHFGGKSAGDGQTRRESHLRTASSLSFADSTMSSATSTLST